MMNYLTLERNSWFYVKVRTLGFCWAVIAPFESVSTLLELALWVSVASPGKRRHDSEGREESQLH